MVRIYTKPDHIRASGPTDYTRTHHYGVVGTISEADARSLTMAALGPVIATAYGTMFRGECRTTQTHYNQWDTEIDYLPRPTDIGTWTWTGDGTGVTEHVTHSQETIAVYPPSATALTRFKGGINWDGKEFQGADIIVPAGRLTVTFNHPAGVMTLAYFRYLQSLAGYVNSDAWLGFAAGEVRFLGPICSDGTATDAQAVYNFDLSANRTGLTVGSIGGIYKLGWHLLWLLSKDSTTTVDGKVVPSREAELVYIERMSSTIAFGLAFGFS